MGKDRAALAGLKLTPQRLAILDHLKGNYSHPSAEDVHASVSARFPTMSLATVYNTLDLLKRRGLVRELGLDRGKKRFDPDIRPHEHLICIMCGRIVDVYDVVPPELGGGAESGFLITGSSVEFHGICPACRQE